MNAFTVTRELMGAPITAQVLRLPVGVQVTLCGGTLPHIGAVSIAGPEGPVQTTQFPTHKDGVVGAEWAAALAEAGLRPAVVVAGIHYDGLTKAEIAEVVAVTREMLGEVLEGLQA